MRAGNQEKEEEEEKRTTGITLYKGKEDQGIWVEVRAYKVLE